MMSSLLWKPSHQSPFIIPQSSLLTSGDKDSASVGFFSLGDNSVNTVRHGRSRSDTDNLVLESDMSVNSGEGCQALCSLDGGQDWQGDGCGELVAQRDGLTGGYKLCHE